MESSNVRNSCRSAASGSRVARSALLGQHSDVQAGHRIEEALRVRLANDPGCIFAPAPGASAERTTCRESFRDHCAAEAQIYSESRGEALSARVIRGAGVGSSQD